jgi:trigger factor
MKRRLLDQLAERSDFEVPPSMVEAEFQNIMQQLRHEASHESDPKAALAEIENEADEYRRIAERRVRLGLLLSEIGAANGVQISDAEMNRLIAQAASQYQGKERERFLQYRPAGAGRCGSASRAAVRGQGRRFPVRQGGNQRAHGDPRSSRRISRARKAMFTDPAAVMTSASSRRSRPKPSSARRARLNTQADEDQGRKPAAKKAKLAEEKSEKPKPAKPKKSEPHNEAAAEKGGKEGPFPAKRLAEEVCQGRQESLIGVGG